MCIVYLLVDGLRWLSLFVYVVDYCACVCLLYDVWFVLFAGQAGGRRPAERAGQPRSRAAGQLGMSIVVVIVGIVGIVTVTVVVIVTVTIIVSYMKGRPSIGETTLTVAPPSASQRGRLHMGIWLQSHQLEFQQKRRFVKNKYLARGVKCNEYVETQCCLF